MSLIVTEGHPGMMAGPGLYQKPVFQPHQIQKAEMPSLSTQGPAVMDIKLLIKWIQMWQNHLIKKKKPPHLRVTIFQKTRQVVLNQRVM